MLGRYALCWGSSNQMGQCDRKKEPDQKVDEGTKGVTMHPYLCGLDSLLDLLQHTVLSIVVSRQEEAEEEEEE